MPDKPQWARQAAMWRDPAEAVSLHRAVAQIDRQALARKVKGDFWGLIEHLGITLLVGREYEHFVMALKVRDGQPHVTYMPLPHPSGIAVDTKRGDVFIASTRNPNQIYTFRPLAGMLPRKDRVPSRPNENPLMPVASRIVPGSLYIHDLALIGGKLHASAVGHNAIVHVGDDRCEPVWWPRAIERRGRPDFGRNYLQLNSIAAGASLRASFFSASSESIGTRFPGALNFPVDKRGVIFSGATREPAVRGLTRPHSVRFWKDKLYFLNSGYGELGVTGGGRFTPVAALPGWTRGLAFKDGYAFIGTSRVIPRFRAYAPGLDVSKSACGVFVIELKTGNVVASIVWPAGNQIFAIEVLPASFTSGFPFRAAAGRDETSRLEALFYAFRTRRTEPT
jgi:uncharacterized protein (TIGR03032 family)